MKKMRPVSYTRGFLYMGTYCNKFLEGRISENWSFLLIRAESRLSLVLYQLCYGVMDTLRFSGRSNRHIHKVKFNVK